MLSIFGCSSDNEDILLGNWVYVGSFIGGARTNAVSFVIDNKVYVGTGYEYEIDSCLSDFWVGTVSADKSLYWTQLSDFTGVARQNAVAFSSATTGYVGLGCNYEDDSLNDFYAYDPVNDSWVSITDFPDEGRIGAVAFFIDGQGYVCAGEAEEAGMLNSCYSFDPLIGSWDIMAPLPDKRTDAMSFILNDEAYVLSGYDNSDYLDDFWKYDSANNVWVELNHISDYEDESFDDDYSLMRYDGVTFVAGGNVYMTSGFESATYSNEMNFETWKWDSVTDRWCRVADFEGESRYGAIAFALNDVGYVMTGANDASCLNDIWYFEPNVE